MSEQNQMAISPVTAGLVGAVAGGGINYFAKIGAKPQEGYRTTQELLTLENDKFEALKQDIEASDNTEAKAEFKKLEDGRTTVSEAGDTLVKEQAKARTEMNAAIEADLEKNLTGDAKTKFEAAVKTEKEALAKSKTDVEALRAKMDTKAGTADAEVTAKRTKLKEAREAARKAITDKVDEGLGKELKDAQAELAAATTDEARKAAQAKVDAANVKIAKEVSGNAEVKAAKEALNVERKKVMTDDSLKPFKERNTVRSNYDKKLVESADEALKDVTAKKDGSALEQLKAKIDGWKAKLAENVDELKKTKAGELVGEKGSLKDLDTGKFKKFLPKARLWPTVIAAAALGAAGVALAYIVGPKNPTPSDVA